MGAFALILIARMTIDEVTAVYAKSRYNFAASLSLVSNDCTLQVKGTCARTVHPTRPPANWIGFAYHEAECGSLHIRLGISEVGSVDRW